LRVQISRLRERRMIPDTVGVRRPTGLRPFGGTRTGVGETVGLTLRVLGEFDAILDSYCR